MKSETKKESAKKSRVGQKTAFEINIRPNRPNERD
jgi:hypothetical protein